jgi:V/A-type H+-transporting ATPase subunit K
MSAQKKNFFILVGITSFAGLAAAAATLLFWFGPAMAATETARAAVDPGVVQWGFLAAAVSTGLSALGAGIAVGGVGAAAIGAIAEKPELLGRTLILVGLAEGIAIYGIIISILILNKVL